MGATLLSDQLDIAIIGAGAAGLAAGIAAGEAAGSRPRTIALLDGAPSLGAKILVSGGGRCNVTHERVAPTDYFGNRRLIQHILAAWTVEQTIDWFASMGVALTREETGKLFPVSHRARTVLDALVTRCRAVGCTIVTHHRVTGIERQADDSFVVQHSHGLTRARTVIVATGGRALPRTGSDGAGYALVRSLGHTIAPTAPALVPFTLSPSMFHADLSGLSQSVEVTTLVDGARVDRRRGSLLWTHVGISGPVVMDASRFWTLAMARGQSAQVLGNFVEGETWEQVRTWFLAEAAAHPRRSLARTWGQRLPERFVTCLCRHLGIDGERPAGQVTKVDRDRLCQGLTAWVFPIERDRGWNHAEVTAGGVPLEEVDFRTMASKVCPGLYLVGEVLDCDGRIGGFNFQWAWATGFLAGRAAAAR